MMTENEKSMDTPLEDANANTNESNSEEEYEYFEIEVDEDDILYYLVDEDDNEVGFAIMEDGKEVEYFYAGDGAEYEYVDEQPCTCAEAHRTAPDDAEAQSAKQKIRNSADSATDKVISMLESDKLADAATEFTAMYKETAEATKEIREAMKDVKDTIDMFNPKKLFR